MLPINPYEGGKFEAYVVHEHFVWSRVELYQAQWTQDVPRRERQSA